MIIRRNNILHRLLLPLWLSSVALLMAACGEYSGASESKLTQTVDSFATYYYNWQFQRALRFTTPQSEQWLRLCASQLTQEDVDLLNQQTEKPSYVIDQLELIDDSTARVSITVQNYLLTDTIGRPARLVDKGSFTLDAVYTTAAQRWMIDLHDVLRNEKK
ncbi:MAG: hypothetical protein J5734_03620 [Prevotella sp.]|nr:hypothetical protein [Prevotella sp.]